MTQRIVSLLPSATEIVCALGLEEQLVGISHCCDFPHSVQQLPVLTRSIVDPSLPSLEIDRLTKEALHRGDSLYALNEELLRELQPDLVITQALCDVCAVSFSSVARAVGSLESSAQLISLEPGCIEDIFSDIRNVARASSRVLEGETLIADGRARLNRLEAQLAQASRPRVLSLEWFEPAYFGGHWVPEQIRFGGGESVLGKPKERSSGVAWQDVAELDPDVIVCMPCGYDTHASRRLLAAVEEQPYFAELRAARLGQVWCVDANGLFSRPSPRVVSGAELLGHIMHPNIVPLPLGVEAPVRCEQASAKR